MYSEREGYKMETITVFKDSYESAIKNEFDYMIELASLRGKIIAMADIIKTNPKFVENLLVELKEEFGKNKVDSAVN